MANLGDSRGVLSEGAGKTITQVSVDHKPGEESERARIMKAKGEVYCTHSESPERKRAISRVFPGKLSVSRTIGDIDAKIKEFGGNPNAVIAEPEVRVIAIGKEIDFIMLGSDGIFDKLENEEVAGILWRQSKECQEAGIENRLGKAVEAVINEAMNCNSTDNVTVLVVAFENFVNDVERFEN